MHTKPAWLLIFVFAPGLLAGDLPPSAASGRCSAAALSESKKEDLAQYVLKRYKLQGSTSVKVIGETLDARTCYRKLKFEGKNAFRTWDLTLYLSPDQRFLSPNVFDTMLDPTVEERRKEQALMSDLEQNKGASRGPANAPVTIVEFADFQCPYCRKLADVMKQVMPGEEGNVRLVFHHLPLQMHPWARAAAEGAACAQLQNSAAFWSMHDQLFDNQTAISPENVHQKLLEFAEHTKSLNLKDFQECMNNQMSLGLVLRDLGLASDNKINATPTLFINGRRLQGVRNASELRQLIDAANNKTSHSTAASIGVRGRTRHMVGVQ